MQILIQTSTPLSKHISNRDYEDYKDNVFDLQGVLYTSTFLFSINQYTPIVKLELNSHFHQEERTAFNTLLTLLMNTSYILCNYFNTLIYNYSFDDLLEPLSFLQSVIPFVLHSLYLLLCIVVLQFVRFKKNTN